MAERLNKGVKRTVPVEIQLDGKPVKAFSGETLATVIVNEKGLGYRKTKNGDIRGPVCNMGVCYECSVRIEGVGNVRACMTNVEDGMVINSESRNESVYDLSQAAFISSSYSDTSELKSKVYDVVVIGAGPAGMGAIEELENNNLKIAVVDEQTQVGGQIYRQSPKEFEGIKKRNELIERVMDLNDIDWIHETAVTGILVDKEEKSYNNKMEYSELKEILLEGKPSILTKRIIIGSGAYDRLLTIPGWTLPGVMSAGGIQLFIKSQGFLPGEKTLLTGNHPFIIIVAEQIIKAGGTVVGINFAQTFPTLNKLIKYGMKSLGHLGKVKELVSALQTIRKAKVPIIFNKIPVIIEEYDGLKKVKIANTKSIKSDELLNEQEVTADIVGMCFGFKASSELARQVGCDMDYDFDKGGWIAKYDSTMQSDIDGVFVAGEITGIGGAEVSEVEGRVAGNGVLSSLNRLDTKSRIKLLNKEKNKLEGFADMLVEATSIPLSVHFSAINNSPEEITICKCEGVTVSQIQETLNDFPDVKSMNAVKLASRCGMGLCQGRYCEDALANMLGIGDEELKKNSSFTARHPIKATSIRGIIE